MTQTLYRKYRPLLFSEIVNQKAVVQTLTNALLNDKVAHAYLFSGPRGTGKTTLARILARALNCQKRQGAEPDNKCAACAAINTGRALDLVEIDAASNRGIDDIRRLKEEIRFGPQQLKYKVFILDEAHMLTRDATNALLKSLEEPPSHTIFILATTEIQKLLPTILSRCQRLDFYSFTLKDIIGRLQFLAKAEKVKIEERAFKAIAVNAKGSLRDAESILGKVLALGESKVTLKFEDVRVLLGIVDQHLAARLIGLLIKKDAQPIFEFINQTVQAGVNPKEFIKTLVEYLRKVALVAADATLADELKDELTQEELKLLASQAAELTLRPAVALIDICLEQLPMIEYYPLEQMALEMVASKYLAGQ